MIGERERFDLLVIGALAVDRIGRRLEPGGSVLFACEAAARIGLRVAAVTVSGDEPAAREGMARLRASATVMRQPATESVRFLHEEAGGRRRLTLEASAPPIEPHDALLTWNPAAVLFAPVADEIRPSLIAMVREHLGGVLAGGAMQGWLRELRRGQTVEPRPLGRIPDELADTIRRLDVLIASDEDLVLEGDDARSCLAALRSWSGERPRLAVTMGADGAWLAHQGEESVVAPRRRLDGVPTIGAGDIFGSVLVARLARSGDYRAAAIEATTVTVEQLAARR